MTTVKIVLPLPDAKLSPNARVHWLAKAKAVKKARGDAGLAACDAQRRFIPAGRCPMWKAATVQATFYRKTKRKIDPDNALASIKAQIDGLRDAGLIADDSGLTHLPVKFCIDKADPRLELEVTKC